MTVNTQCVFTLYGAHTQVKRGCQYISTTDDEIGHAIDYHNATCQWGLFLPPLSAECCMHISFRYSAEGGSIPLISLSSLWERETCRRHPSSLALLILSSSPCYIYQIEFTPGWPSVKRSVASALARLFGALLCARPFLCSSLARPIAIEWRDRGWRDVVI